MSLLRRGPVVWSAPDPPDPGAARLIPCGGSRCRCYWWGGACAPDSAQDVIDNHREQLADPPIDCGGYESHLISQECPQPLSEEQQCLWNAFADCESAELVLVLHGIDSASHATWFVEPGSDGECTITKFSDNSRDPYKGDYGDLRQFSCPVLTDPQQSNPQACATLQLDDCELVEEWYFD